MLIDSIYYTYEWIILLIFVLICLIIYFRRNRKISKNPTIDELLTFLAKEKKKFHFQFVFPFRSSKETNYRKNFNIPNEEKIYIARDNSFFQSGDQGLIIHSSGITQIKDNDKPYDKKRIKWIETRYVQYEKDYLIFFDERNNYTCFHIGYFCKPNDVSKLPHIGLMLAESFNRIVAVNVPITLSPTTETIAQRARDSSNAVFVELLKDDVLKGTVWAIVKLEMSAKEGNVYAQNFLNENRHSLPKISQEDFAAHSGRCPKCNHHAISKRSDGSEAGTVIKGASTIAGHLPGLGLVGFIGSIAGEIIEGQKYRDQCNKCHYQWQFDGQGRVKKYTS